MLECASCKTRATETIERGVELSGITLASPRDVHFHFESIAGAGTGQIVCLAGTPSSTGLSRLTVRVNNQSPAQPTTREEALAASMLSTHTILTLTGGEFVSMIDPPAEYREAVAACRNIGTFPVLAGPQGERDCILSSPIILYDYPQVAPESPGDLFDALEIDEILTLRILTLSDQEKAEIRVGDERARQVLERSECMPPGAIDETSRRASRAAGHLRLGKRRRNERIGIRTRSNTKLDRVRIQGIEVKEGDLVRLRPRRSADILDLALKGKLATVEAIEQDMEGQVHFAVVIEDDPGRDLGMLRQPGHRFFFGTEEVDPIR